VAFLPGFLLERGEPGEPLIETLASLGRKGQVVDLRMNLSRVFQGELGIEFDVGKKVRLGQDHQRSAVKNPRIFSGLSSPSVTLNRTIFAASPRS